MWLDARQVVRGIGRRRGSAFAVALTLGVCLGFNAAVFAFLDAVILRPFPFREPSQIVVIWGSESFDTRPGIDGRDVEAWRAAARSVESVGAFQLTPIPVALDAGPSPATASATMISPEGLALLGVGVALGRPLQPAEADGAADVALISHRLWRSRFGGDAATLGRSVYLGGRPYQVVGVMPAGFFFPGRGTDVWVPLRRDSQTFAEVQAIARVRGGLALPAVKDDLSRTRLSSADAAGGRPTKPLGVFTLHHFAVAEHERATWTLYGIVTLLFLTACLNASSWSLSRLLENRHATETRLALGASRLSVVRLAALEPLAVVLLALPIGLLWMRFGFAILSWADFSDVPKIDLALLDRVTATYVIGAAGAAACLVPALPAAFTWRLCGWSRGPGSAQATAGQEALRSQRWLLGLQVAGATTLVIVGSALLGNFVNLTRADMGFDPAHVVAVETSLPRDLTAERARHVDFTELVVGRIRGTPGVEVAAVAHGVPIKWGSTEYRNIAVDGRLVSTAVWAVGVGYFEALRIPILSGAPLRAAAAPERELLVNRRLASVAWPGKDPVGQQLELLHLTPQALARVRADRSLIREIARDPASYEPEGAPWTIVGVVPDVRMYGLEDGIGPAVYLEYRNWDNRRLRQQVFIARSEGGEVAAIEAIKGIVAAAGQGVRAESSYSLSRVVSESIGGRGSRGLLAVVGTVFTALAIVVSAGGVYGILALVAAQRQRDVAVRSALGASPLALVAGAYKREGAAVALGAAAGLIVGILSARAVEAGVPSEAGLSLAVPLAAVALLAMACVLAAIEPVRRVLSADPAARLKAQ